MSYRLNKQRTLALCGSSQAPDGKIYPIPTHSQIDRHFEVIRRRAESFRAKGRKVVVVQGLGFVGSAVAAVVAASQDESRRDRYFVIGIDLPTKSSYWKIARINEGRSPVESPDSNLDRFLSKAVKIKGNLMATACEDAYSLADIIIVDIPLDVKDRFVRDPRRIKVNLDAFKSAIRIIGRKMKNDALVMVETTVPVGSCEKIVLPILKEERRRRGLSEEVCLAHAYERVMPGPSYIDSIRRFWRSFSAIDKKSERKARQFLATIIDTKSYPLHRLDDTSSSELAKVLENSYRATNIAFIYEWALLAEGIGVNLFDIVESIKVRKGTHDNIRYPGFGVGGYCLTKDQLLAQWGGSRLFDSRVLLKMTFEALHINARMPLHVFDLLNELTKGHLSRKKVAVCGVAYIPEVADTRNSPTEILVDRLKKAGARVLLHDQCVKVWNERPDFKINADIEKCLKGADCVVFAVGHRAYHRYSARDLIKLFGRSRPVVIDAQNVISDSKAKILHAAGCSIAGVGKGHWRKKGYQGRR